jgi:hypothetical protein
VAKPTPCDRNVAPPKNPGGWTFLSTTRRPRSKVAEHWRPNWERLLQLPQKTVFERENSRKHHHFGNMPACAAHPREFTPRESAITPSSPTELTAVPPFRLWHQSPVFSVDDKPDIVNIHTDSSNTHSSP